MRHSKRSERRKNKEEGEKKMSLSELLKEKSIFHIWLCEKNTYSPPVAHWNKLLGAGPCLCTRKIYIPHFKWKLNMMNNVSGEKAGEILLLQCEGNACPHHTGLVGEGTKGKKFLWYQGQDRHARQEACRGPLWRCWMTQIMMINMLALWTMLLGEPSKCSISVCVCPIKLHPEMNDPWHNLSAQWIYVLKTC